jgi:hypothetical protein
MVCGSQREGLARTKRVCYGFFLFFRRELSWGYRAEGLKMKRLCLRIILVLGFLAIGVAAITVLGCATTFMGSARVQSGPSGCRAKCAAWDMELAGMVAVGEYSDGCICEVPGRRSDTGASIATGAAAVGTIQQMRQQQASQQAAHHNVYVD